MSAAQKIESDPSVIAHALAYAAKGWHVFPAEFDEPNKKKKSRKAAEFSKGRAWGATIDAAEIRRDFRRWPDAIGIVTGPKSGIFVVEADTPEGHDVDGIASLKALEAKHGTLPETLMGESPSGSLHYYFKWPTGVTIRNDTSKIAPGVDQRGEGGMVIAPPSLRPGKGVYRWLNAIEPAEAPQWLIDLATADDGDEERTPGDEPEADPDKIAAAMADYPNDDVFPGRPAGASQNKYNKIGMAIWRATGGSERGFEIFDTWARKSEKYHGGTRERWRHYFKSPPNSIGAGTIFFMADKACPGWREAYEQATDDDATRERLAMIAAACAAGVGPSSPSQGEQIKASTGAIPKPEPAPPPHLIQPSGEFVSGFVPPDYLIDGWLQRRFVYSITGMTGHGKTTVMLYIAVCAALGIKIDSREVEKCRVLFFAGENPDDIRMRWIKLCEEMGHDPADIDVFFLPGTPPISDKEICKRIYAETTKHGPFGLLIIDTSAAYFQGDDENSNTQLGNHARMMRSFVNLPGGPTVVVTCHPTKNPSMDNLLPRGGGAFLAEVDGNLVCIKGDGTVSIHWHGKLRGPDFAPILFKLKPGTTEKLKDKKGRLIWTITATPITEAEKADIEDVSRTRQNELLMLLEKEPRLSLSEMAVKLNWQYKTGMPNTSLAHRMIAALVQDKLVVKKRGKITLTKTGAEEIAAAKKAKTDVPS